MITNQSLGKHGRLGNQIFQYAFLFGLSDLKKYDFCIPPETDLQKCFDLNCKIQPFSLSKGFVEKQFHYDQSFDSYTDNTNYTGYFQTEKYFYHCKEKLINSLRFREEHKKVIPFCESKDLVSIHIRRGDYVGNKHHPLISMDYINQAKSKFEGKKFLIFSDDIEWCKTNKLGDYYSENTSHYTDLYWMTMCESSIISNSSFSWWGAYLSNKSKIVAPKNWFSGNNTRNSTKDLYCKDWIII
jgi:hypothetical protein